MDDTFTIDYYSGLPKNCLIGRHMRDDTFKTDSYTFRVALDNFLYATFEKRKVVFEGMLGFIWVRVS